MVRVRLLQSDSVYETQFGVLQKVGLHANENFLKSNALVIIIH